MKDMFACAKCGHTQDDFTPCAKCGSVRVVSVSTLIGTFGPGWRESFTKPEPAITAASITEDTKVTDLQTLMTENKLDVRMKLCPNGFHVVLTINDEESWADNQSFTAVAPRLWTALLGAFLAFLDWKRRQ